MQQLPDIPVFVLTGFLGAGKTTLLNDVLRADGFADTMVIVNEFGAVGLDHLLMAEGGEGVALLASGCLCCAMRGDLIDTLADLARRRLLGDLPPFARVIIETSGLADPGPIMQSILLPETRGLGYSLAGVVTAVDALDGLSTLQQESISVAQVAVADRVVITKSDMSAPPPELNTALAAINPRAEVVSKAGVSLVWLFALPLSTMPGKARGSRFTCHDASVGSLVLASGIPFTAAMLDEFLGLLVDRLGERLLRLKALVRLDDNLARPLVVQGVRHRIYPTARLRAWPPGEIETTFVIIGRDLDPVAVEQLFSAFTGAAMPDTPDRMALTDNPLAL